MMTFLKIVWLIAFPIILLALFIWARGFNGKKVDTKYMIKCIFWSLVCDIPFLVWFFG